MAERIGDSPVGTIERVPNLKKRQRSIYYRLINEIWMQTMLLPSDTQGKETYLSKGFLLSPPEGVDFSPIKSDPEKDQLLARIADLEAKLADRPKIGRPKGT